MRWQISSTWVVVVVGLTACGGGDRPGTGFVDVDDAAPTPVMVLRDDSSRTADGHRVAELDVLMPLVRDEAGARSTLQRLIDSISAADTLAAAVRVTGYVMGNLDPETSSADLVPALRATWGPIDSAGFTGSRRRSRYRTNFVVLRPFDPPPAPGRQP